MSTTTHFTYRGYTVIKTPLGQYSFTGIEKADMTQHLSLLQKEIREKQRKIAALTLFLGGKSESNPNALYH
jgi:hypothetical protein